MIKIAEKELSFLSMDEVSTLLTACERHNSPDLALMVKLCLSTGARWGEVVGLEKRHVKQGKITFTNTKSKKNRTVPISNDLSQEIEARPTGTLFHNTMDSFRDMVAACELNLPKGQLTHVLRHTFASHFIMNGGNILVLQKILGHSTVTMTMRYAHLAPDHLQEAVTLNPLARCGQNVDTPDNEQQKSR